MPQFGGKNAKKTSSTTKRHFTVVMGGKEHGLYVSSTPSSAARKAVTKLCAANKSKKVVFHIREITQDSKKKTYGPYEGYIEKLKEPIELKGRVIKYKPVAKLSGKTGAKKGGMRGGANRLDRTIPFKIKLIGTDNSNHNEIINSTFAGQIFILAFIDYIEIVEVKQFYVKFIFKGSVTDNQIIEIIKSKSNKINAKKLMKDHFNIKKQWNIVIYIPYILEDGSKKTYSYVWFNYDPASESMMSDNDSDIAGINYLRLNKS